MANRSSSSGKREIWYCANDRTPATQRVKRIIGAGDLGVTVQYGLCDTCAGELVRTTQDRYEIQPLPRGSRVTTAEGVQESWDMP